MAWPELAQAIPKVNQSLPYSFFSDGFVAASTPYFDYCQAGLKQA
jgi:hypothetical protein